MSPPDDHTPKSKPPALDKAKELTSAANALIIWANAQEISRADLMLIMSKVSAKIIVDTVRLDIFELSQAVDDVATRLANDINSRLHQVRADQRLNWKRKDRDNG